MLDCVIRYTLVFVALTLIGVKLYLKLTIGRCNSKRQMRGKTVIVTGSNSGIGKITALDLARRGARVILACRDIAKAEAARREMVMATGHPDIVVMKLDLSKVSSVREFCKKVLENEKRLDVLVNNAAIAGLQGRRLTEDGLETQMATNHFGPFLLTHLLIGLLKRSAPSRIVTVSSIVHSWTNGIDFDNLNAEKSYKSITIYQNTKMANVLFTKEMARRLQGTGVTVNCLHPGVVATELFRNLTGILKFVFDNAPFYKSPEEGAQTSIYLAVSEEVDGVSGKYFADCKVAEESAYARDPGVARKLWEVSEEICKLQPHERI